jgi:peroxiredoxin
MLLDQFPLQNGGATINGQELLVARSVIVMENEGESRYYAMSFNYQKTRGKMIIQYP